MQNKTLAQAQKSLDALIQNRNKKSSAKATIQRSLDDIDRELTELSREIARLRDYILKITPPQN